MQWQLGFGSFSSDVAMGVVTAAVVVTAEVEAKVVVVGVEVMFLMATAEMMSW